MKRNVPLSFFDHHEVRELLKYGADEVVVDFVLNSQNLGDLIKKSATKLRQLIKNEISDRMISLKYDSASRLNRGIFGVNCQFMVEGKIVIRTLAMQELTTSHTGEHLKDEILDILSNYSIEKTQIYSSTSDNGTNMLKASELLEESIFSEVEELTKDKEFDLEPDLSVLSSVFSVLRCAPHTFQLFVDDFVKTLKDEIPSVRNFVKAARTPTNRRLLTANKVKQPPLDVETRWSSTYKMLKHVLDNKQFYDEVFSSCNPKLGKLDFEFIENFINCFKPVYEATLKLQENQLIYGDVYKLWLDVQIQLSEMILSNPYAEILLDFMDKRKSHLFESRAFKSAMYLDLRFNYLNSNHLSDKEKEDAKVYSFFLNSILLHKKYFAETFDFHFQLDENVGSPRRGNHFRTNCKIIDCWNIKIRNVFT